MKIPGALISIRGRLAEISILSSIALFSSLYLQYVALYQPCRYCLILRYLTAGILVVSLAAQFTPNLAKTISALVSGAGIVGAAVSTLLIIDDLFPAAGICTSCAFSPVIMGISLSYYSFTYMVLVLGLSVSIVLKGEGPEDSFERGSTSDEPRLLDFRRGPTWISVISLNVARR